MPNNEVRIIGGQWKGRKLSFPARKDLRPTLGRVRETLFNWLAPLIGGTSCLDLFAGSGALGFEALSRGAAEVTFVERDRKVADSLRRNVAVLGCESRATVHCAPAAEFLTRSDARFDLVFFDPPFAGLRSPDSRYQTLLPGLFSDTLAADGLVYLEAPRRHRLPAAHFHKHSQAGDCQFALIRAEDFEPA